MHTKAGLQFAGTLVLIALSTSEFSKAHAVTQTMPERSCDIYFSDQSGLSNSIKDAIVSRKDVAAAICTDSGGSITRYSSITPVSESNAGICVFQEILRFESAASILASSAQTYMERAKGGCPKQDDPSYIPANGVSTGVFAALLSLWGELSSTNERFAESFAIPREKNGAISKLI